MTHPSPLLRICGRIARVTRMAPNRLVSNTSRIFSSLICSSKALPPRPALLTSTSISPNRSMPFATAASTLTLSVTSSRATNRLSNLFNSVSFSGVRMVAITFQPLAWKVCAAKRPMPEEHPVIKTVFCVILTLLNLSQAASTLALKTSDHRAC